MAPPAADVKANRDGSVTVHYVPSESGPHDINVTYNEKPVAGTPFRVNVCAGSAGDGKYISAYGPGLSQGCSGDQLEFFLTGAATDFDISIEGPGKVDILKKEESGGVVHVVYMTLTPGEYDIHIRHHGKHMHGSPFSLKISGEGRKRSQVSSGATSNVSLGGKEVDFANMMGEITGPTGTKEHCLLRKMADGKLGVSSFQPRVKGSYSVSVTQDGKPISGSPFKLQVDDNHVCSAPKVVISGALKDALANKINEIHFNIAKAGYGALAISVEGPHRSDLELKADSLTEYTLQYKPHEPGVYLLNAKFGDDHITGSPFMLKVGGEPSGRIRETVTKELKPLDPATIGQTCHMEMKIPGTDPLEMEATLTTPSGKSEDFEIREMPDNMCSLKFTPTEEGVNTISLKYKGMHFAGSPFQYTVGKVPSGGSHKVEFGGPGVEQGEVRTKNEFNIYYREAGQGTLTISIEGPAKAKMDVVDRGNGYVTVGYVVDHDGEYGVHVKFNDEHVPESPATVRVLPVSQDAKKVAILGLRNRGLDVGRPVTFNLNKNGAHGELKAHVSTPSGQEEDATLTDCENDMYCVRFVPKENGVYYVYLKLNEAHIPGSPLPMLIGKQGADPALVLANGTGLEGGEVGKASKFKVVTLNAGPAILAVHIDGPSKVAFVCTEATDGYEFSYTPMAPGNFMIMIKYSNVTIAGAPFKAVVSGTGKGSEITETSRIFVETVDKKPGVSNVKKFKGDASRVVAQGNGLKKGFFGRAATFTLDVKDAGQALLTMGMISPSGNPLNEISVKRTRPTIYNVGYNCPEKGDYTLIIRWGSDDIPGSPFSIPVQ